MYPDVRSLVSALQAAGELVRVGRPVSAVCEISAMADRASKMPAPGAGSAATARTDPEFHGRGGPALLFENVEGSDFPVLINAYGSYRRVEMALGAGLEEIAARIGEVAKPEPPRSLREAVAKARRLAPLLRIGPRRVRGAGACQEVVKTGPEIDLTRIPMLRCWPLDGDFAAMGYDAGINDGVEGAGHPGIDAARWEAQHRGRYITLAGVHTIHADERGERRPRTHNIGMYRVQLVGKDRLAMHWHMHHDGAAHWRSWTRLGEPMPVAIVLGGPSVLAYAATCPLPPGMSELLMAGFLQGRGVRLCRARTVPLWVPAGAEMVIEGWVRTDCGGPGWEGARRDRAEQTERRRDAVEERRVAADFGESASPRPSPRGGEGAEPLGPGAWFEGPFGDHTGFYSLPDRYPLVEVTAVTHRRGAVFPATVVGLPPQEDYFLGKATERIMRPLLGTILPDIADYDLPMFGAFHNCAVVQIRKQYPLHARKVMHGVWGAGQMAWTKTVIVVDEGVDCHDLTAVLGEVCRWCRPSRDIEVVHGALDILDHAAPRLGAGTKIGFDATRKVAGEEVDGRPLGGPREEPTPAERERAVAWARAIPGVLEAAAPERAPGWLFIRADRGVAEPAGAGLGARIIERYLEGAGALPFVVVLGRDVDVHDHHAALFHWVANSDAGRDAVWWGGRDEETERRGDGVGGGPAWGVVAFDATPKTAGDARNGQPVREWPGVLRFDEELIARAEAEMAKGSNGQRAKENQSSSEAD